jgi:hypothetical protein
MQFRGIPDGAQIDLDDRFWLDAQGLDQRWLAIPDGRHTITSASTETTRSRATSKCGRARSR